MLKNDPQRSGDEKSADFKKKSYQKPRILSVESLEVVAATCGTSKAVLDLPAGCGSTSPLNS